MGLFELSLFFAVTALAGAINSVAGGGTFLTFPVFIMNGLTAYQANIMSTIALWPGTITSAYGYKNILNIDRKRFTPLLIIGLIGGAAGSITFLKTSDIFFKQLVPYLLLSATIIFTFGRNFIALLHKKLPNKPSDKNQYNILGNIFQLVIAFYGGYFGAGIGILTLAMLQLIGFSNIHEMNAIKTILVCAINFVTVIIFIISGVVVWNLAAVMIAGGMLGGYVGARIALKIPPNYVRIFVSVIGFSMSLYFFTRS
ncbi:MAG: sulfite exporter TauE/SafE family protein [Rickettsiales bacterium]